MMSLSLSAGTTVSVHFFKHGAHNRLNMVALQLHPFIWGKTLSNPLYDAVLNESGILIIHNIAKLPTSTSAKISEIRVSANPSA